MQREEKGKIIQELQDRANRAVIAVVTDFQGMNAEEITQLRRNLRENNIEFRVVKNTLARIALDGSPHAAIKDKFKDCCAIAFGYDDPVTPAKVLVNFEKKSKKFKTRFASLEGRYMEAAAMKELSELPGRDELMARMLGTMNAVPTNFVSLCANLVRGLMNVLDGIKEQKENQSK